MPAGFVSLKRLAQHVVILLIIGAVFDAVSVISTLSEIELLEGLQRGEAFADGVTEANDSRQMLIAGLQFVLFLVTAVFFLRWLSRAYRNLPSLSGRPHAFKPQWAVSSWFIPFLNLVRPYQIVAETLAVSSSAANSSLAEPPRPALLKWWWAIWVLAGFLGQAVFRTSLSAETPSELLSASYVAIAADLVTIAAAILAIQVVKLISVAQERAGEFVPGR